MSRFLGGRISATLVLLAQAVALIALCACNLEDRGDTAMLSCHENRRELRMSGLEACCCEEPDRGLGGPTARLSPTPWLFAAQVDENLPHAVTRWLAPRTAFVMDRRGPFPPRPPLRV